MEEKIFYLLESTINQLGFDLVKVSMQGSKHKVLQVLIDRQDGQKVQVGDCSLVSKNISALLDVEDYIKDKYFLEVSSAGSERPLVKINDFIRFKDSEVKITLKNQFNDRTKYKGKILAVQDNWITIESKNIPIKLDYHNIKTANLVLSDKMFRMLLTQSKKNKKKGKNMSGDMKHD